LFHFDLKSKNLKSKKRENELIIKKFHCNNKQIVINIIPMSLVTVQRTPKTANNNKGGLESAPSPLNNDIDKKKGTESTDTLPFLDSFAQITNQKLCSASLLPQLLSNEKMLNNTDNLQKRNDNNENDDDTTTSNQTSFSNASRLRSYYNAIIDAGLKTTKKTPPPPPTSNIKNDNNKNDKLKHQQTENKNNDKSTISPSPINKPNNNSVTKQSKISKLTASLNIKSQTKPKLKQSSSADDDPLLLVINKNNNNNKNKDNKVTNGSVPSTTSVFSTLTNENNKKSDIKSNKGLLTSLSTSSILKTKNINNKNDNAGAGAGVGDGDNNNNSNLNTFNNNSSNSISGHQSRQLIEKYFVVKDAALILPRRSSISNGEISKFSSNLITNNNEQTPVSTTTTTTSHLKSRASTLSQLIQNYNNDYFLPPSSSILSAVASPSSSIKLKNHRTLVANETKTEVANNESSVNLNNASLSSNVVAGDILVHLRSMVSILISNLNKKKFIYNFYFFCFVLRSLSFDPTI
jgi:hypothetical protein